MKYLLTLFIFPLFLFANETILLTKTDINKIFILAFLLAVTFIVIFILYIRTNKLKNNLNLLNKAFDTKTQLSRKTYDLVTKKIKNAG